MLLNTNSTQIPIQSNTNTNQITTISGGLFVILNITTNNVFAKCPYFLIKPTKKDNEKFFLSHKLFVIIDITYAINIFRQKFFPDVIRYTIQSTHIQQHVTCLL